MNLTCGTFPLARTFLFGGGQEDRQLSRQPMHADGMGRIVIDHARTAAFIQWSEAVINPATGEPAAERKKWALSLKATDASGQALPNNVAERRVIPICKFDRESGDVTLTVQEQPNLYLRDLLGTLPGSRTAVSSIAENQPSFAAAEGIFGQPNHPTAGNYFYLATDNGTICNADYLFRRLGLPRCAEADSELIFRLADRFAPEGPIGQEGLKKALALCRGRTSAPSSSLSWTRKRDGERWRRRP